MKLLSDDTSDDDEITYLAIAETMVAIIFSFGIAIWFENFWFLLAWSLMGWTLLIRNKTSMALSINLFDPVYRFCEEIFSSLDFDPYEIQRSIPYSFEIFYIGAIIFLFSNIFVFARIIISLCILLIS